MRPPPSSWPRGWGSRRRPAAAVYERVRDKLAVEPVEDLRIDFEDGYGSRPDDEEDAAAAAAAQALREALDDGRRAAVRRHPVQELRARTPERAAYAPSTCSSGSSPDPGALPPGFVVTLPKVTSVDQVEAMVLVCEQLEAAHALTPGSLRFEIQVETPQSVLGPDGTALVAPMVHASGGRCTGLHYGTYDYSASCGIAAAYQSMEHPAADYAKAVMQAAAAGTGVHLSDGSTNVLPVGDHASVLAAWRLHARLVRRSLERGLLPGLGPAPRPAAKPVRRDLRLLRRGTATSGRASSRVRAAHRIGLHGRAGHRRGARGLRAAGSRVWCRVRECDCREQASLTRAQLGRLARRPPTRDDSGASRPMRLPPSVSAQVNAAPEAELRRLPGRLLRRAELGRRGGGGAAVRRRRRVGRCGGPVRRVAFTAEDVDRALAAHPRIGDKAAGGSAQARWSRAEQSSVSSDVLDAPRCSPRPTAGTRSGSDGCS
ncbi:MAG: 2-oxo-4-hydroxy-4-carboxy-5-ureidoimidazoline decarboxylase [Nocardioidaceae bacterium]